jgi:hypothetical protein
MSETALKSEQEKDRELAAQQARDAMAKAFNPVTEDSVIEKKLLDALTIMPQDLKVAVLDYAEYLINKHIQNNSTSIIQSQESQKKRQAGLLKGKIWMADDFDAPLEEMQDYM